MRKKLLLSLWVAGVLWLGSFAVVNAQGNTSTSPTFDWNATFEGSTRWEDSKWVNTLWSGEDQEWNLINVIKRFINWVLWIMSLVVLVIVLVWGFQMVTASGNEEKYKKWFTILKHAGIWLVVIGLSWFIVTIIFWILRWSTTSA
jgi:hypothetical protein